MIQLTLLTREGCHLCDSMKAVVARVGEKHPIALHEVDIGTNRDLEERFGEELPVLMLQERVIARSRISVPDLLAQIEGSETKTG